MSDSSANSGDIFDMKKLRRMVELMEEHDLSEIDLKQGDQRIRVRRGAEFVTTGQPMIHSPPSAARPLGATSGASPAPTEDANLAVIKSPMVGTFYSAANPESPPFVKVGDHIGPDSVVCIIEAMKVFNEIPAEVAGQIAAVLVENGAPVEFGQPLFKVQVRK
ncbi:MAG TPA: acetyl-CoA carboxylase biotin carboxyl carrier protein [Pirellulales bacterium]|jgi:acetyl-CoA carboxylase biotin carboxyl carrier protein|nr:acetyl-CoA carboxylase biotin carboxyl carrier protein [Pirellulales bacterium]